jgi:hypothetical protein
MKHRIAVAAIATAAALAGAGALVVPAASASASPSAVKSHTITVTSVQESMLNYSQTVNIVQEKDVNKAGKVIGYDVLHVVFNPKTETAKLNIVLAADGGFLYAVASASSSPVIRGTVTGGTGIFQGAAGTLLAKNLNQAGTKTAVTITYHT